MPARKDAYSLRDVRQMRGATETLRGVSAELPLGEVVALVGPSGAGKTSLLRLLNRLDDPVSGSIDFHGAPITAIPVRELRRRAAFVFQAPVMFPGTVRENLELARSLLPSGLATNARDIDEALRLVGLDASFVSRDAGTLSGGERQRVSIARALVSAPEVLLLDEPSSALDPEVAEHLMMTMRTLASDARLTIIMVTHRLAEARTASTYTVFLEAGVVVEAGQTTEMFTAPREPRSRTYLLGRE